MLRKGRNVLYSEVSDDGVGGVFSHYACRLGADGRYFCTTENLRYCGGLHSTLCKHILVMVIAAVRRGELDRARAQAWAEASRAYKPLVDRDAAIALFLRWKGAQAGTVDWRPTETLPEDYHAL